MRKNTLEHILSECSFDKKSGCLLYPGLTKGYANVRYLGKSYGRHRLIWLLIKGKIKKGLLVLHKCDIKRCININHLKLGTSFDNAQDHIRFGRNHELNKTQCPRGHKYAGSNLVVRKNKRFCKQCSDDYNRRTNKRRIYESRTDTK